jgi:hypothetical protein
LLTSCTFIGLLFYSGFTNLSSKERSDSGCWEDAKPNPNSPRAERGSSLPGRGGCE